MLPPALTPALLRQLELFRLVSRRAHLGTRQGGHISTKRGQGIEFSEYREYELGDSPRWIDWGVFARSDRLYVRRYQEEQNLSVLILLDNSASLWTPREDNKWERARDIALALSYLGFMEQERVCVTIPGGAPIPTMMGGSAIHRLSEVLMSIKAPCKGYDLCREALKGVAQLKMPGIAIILSDFLWPLDEMRKVFTMLQARNLDITALQVMGLHDRAPFTSGTSAQAIDSETGEELDVSFEGDAPARFAYLYDTHVKEIREFCGSRRIGFVTAHTKDTLSHHLFHTLSSTGLLER